MTPYKVASVIVALSEGLSTLEARDRMAVGVRLINDTKDDVFSSKLINKIAMPIFARTVHKNHRFDIREDRYIDLLLESILEMVEPMENDSIVPKGSLGKPLDPTGNDEEARWMAETAGLFMRYVDITTPV